MGDRLAFDAIARGRAAEDKRRKKAESDIAYSEGRARQRAAKFEDFEDRLKMESLAEAEADRRRKVKMNELMAESQSQLSAFKQAGKIIDKAVEKAGGKYAQNMSMEDQWKVRQGMQARGQYPNDVVRAGKEAMFRHLATNAELNKVVGAKLAPEGYGFGGGGAANTRAKQRNDAREGMRFDERENRKAAELEQADWDRRQAAEAKAKEDARGRWEQIGVGHSYGGSVAPGVRVEPKVVMGPVATKSAETARQKMGMSGAIDPMPGVPESYLTEAQRKQREKAFMSWKPTDGGFFGSLGARR